MDEAANALDLYLLYYAAAERVHPVAVLLHNAAAESVRMRFLENSSTIGAFDQDVLELLAEDLHAKLDEFGANKLIHWMTSTLSHTIRISEPKRVFTDDANSYLDDAFDELVRRLPLGWSE